MAARRPRATLTYRERAAGRLVPANRHLPRQWAGYLGLVLVIGLTGGVALGAAAAARRTESSFPVFLASTNPSDLTVQYSQANASAGMPPFARAVAGLPLVRHAESAVEPVADVLGPGGAPLAASIAASLTVASVASVDGLYFDQDRVGVLAGRMASPASRDEIMMDARAASLLGLHVGELVPVGFYTDAQAGAPGYGTARVRPVVRIEARITGLFEFNDELVQDDADRPQGDLLFTPALTKALLAAGTSSGISWYGLNLDGGTGSVPAVEREVDGRLGAGGAAWFKVASADEAQVQSSIEPDWIALGAFAVIALAVALLVGAQAVARQIRAGDGDRMVLRALGAGPAMVTADSLLGTLGGVAAGSLLAVAVAVDGLLTEAAGKASAADYNAGLGKMEELLARYDRTMKTVTWVLRAVFLVKTPLLGAVPWGPPALGACYLGALGFIVCSGGDYVDWYRLGQAGWLDRVPGCRSVVRGVKPAAGT